VITQFKVGQTVLVLPTYSRGGRGDLEPIGETTVTRVGRTRVFVREYGRERPYRVEEQDASEAWAVEDPAQTRIMTTDAWDRAVKRRELYDRIDTNHFPWSRLSIDQLETILEMIEGRGVAPLSTCAVSCPQAGGTGPQ